MGNDHAYHLSADLVEQALRSIRQVRTTLEHMIDLLQKLPASSAESNAVQTPVPQPSASSARPAAPGQEPDLFSRLYTILRSLPILDLREICHTLQVDYQRLTGTSSAEHALSLAEELQNYNRLDELRLVLQRRYPKRF
ncbi:MAG TPA: hypothetical protein VGF67_04840 [Ktedonobacteraceae bacterium]